MTDSRSTPASRRVPKRRYQKPYTGEVRGLSPYELRALVFWAAIGVSKSDGGSYHDILAILPRWAEEAQLELPVKPEFKDE